MSVLTNIVHFRGETVTLYATFKRVIAIPESTGFDVIEPRVKIEYANAAGQVIEILPAVDMVPISAERFYYNWTIPDTAPLTTYICVYSGEIQGERVSRTEELVVGNPAITVDRNYLRYGAGSFLLRPRPRVWTEREHPAMPRGTF